MMKALISIGWIVKFWAQSLMPLTKGYEQSLQDLGVEIFDGPTQAPFPSWLAQNASEIDCVLLSRPTVAVHYLDHVKELTRAKVVYYGHDIHFARMRLQAQITKNRRLRDDAANMERVERGLWRAADLVLYLSDEEIETVRSLENGIESRAVTPYSFQKFVSRSAPPIGATVIFVAGFAHAPNVDAAIWLVENILPLVWRERNDVKLSLIGSDPTLEVRALARRGVEVTGFVGKDELAKRYASARVAVIPLRFGAGVKLKVVEAMQSGLPIVTTPVGAQGMNDLANIVPVCEDDAAIAHAMLKLLSDEEAWWRQSASQLTYVRQRFSEDAMCQSVAQALETIGYSNLQSSPPHVATAARPSVQWTGGYGPPSSSVT
jgi:glycosyltransferase involved in cell wall biosynthesis